MGRGIAAIARHPRALALADVSRSSPHRHRRVRVASPPARFRWRSRWRAQREPTCPSRRTPVTRHRRVARRAPDADQTAGPTARRRGRL